MTPIQSFIKICVSFLQQHLNFSTPHVFWLRNFIVSFSHWVPHVLLLYF